MNITSIGDPHRRRGRLGRQHLVAAGAVLAAVAALALNATTVSAAAPSGSLAVTGADHTTHSTTTVTGGDPIDYTVGATNDTAGAASMRVVDTLGAGQSLVPGSLQAPPGYTVGYSTDGGSTFTGTEPASGVTAVRATGTSVTGSKGAATPIPTPTSTITTPTSNGDGYQPIFFDGNVYNVHHHAHLTNRTLDCHVQATGDPCASAVPGDTVWPSGGYNVLPTAGTPLTADPTSIDTSSNPFARLDSAAGQLWVPVGIHGQHSAGLACIDLLRQTSCGYSQVYATTQVVGVTDDQNQSSNVATQGISGGVIDGTKFYVLGDTSQVFCVDTATNPVTPCGGPVESLPTTPANSTWGASAGEIRTFDGVHLWTAFQEPGRLSVEIGCVDVSAAMTRCAGFNAIVPFPTQGRNGINMLLPFPDSSGNDKGICAMSYLGVVCLNLSGGFDVNPYYPRGAAGFAGQGAPVVIGTKVYYMAVISPGDDGNTDGTGEVYTCHDFAEAPLTQCAGFNPTLMPGYPLKAYTLSQDPAHPNCVWEMGDAGIFDVLDATTGANAFTGGDVSACGSAHTVASVTVSPADFYCDGQSHATTYDALSIAGLSNGFSFAGSLTLTDEDGDPVAVPGGPTVTQASFPLDLTSIPTSDPSALTAHLSITVASQSPWSGQSAPSLQLTFAGDAPQLCLRAATVVDCPPALSALTNHAALQVDGVDAATADYSLNLAASSTCPPTTTPPTPTDGPTTPTDGPTTPTDGPTTPTDGPTTPVTTVTVTSADAGGDSTDDGSNLAFTGSDVLTIVAIGMVLLLLGCAFSTGGRRRSN